MAEISSPFTPAVPRAQRLILACFFVSGATGLIYEIIWTRLLALIMGATVYSLTTVLVAFMAGLGLGAFLISGPLRRHPEWSRLKLYGLFEIIIGLWCLALPWMISLARPLFAVAYNRLYGDDPGALLAYSLVQFGILMPLLLVPTTLMGATLPLLTDHVARRPEDVGRSVGKVYGINTLGAVVGSLAAGYVLVQLIGFHFTNLFAVAGNVGVGLIALRLARGDHGHDPATERAFEAAPGRRLGRGATALIFLIFGLSGLASMTYQVAWTRIISLVIDSTTYSFTIIVTCFIFGLALGAWLLSPLIDRDERPVLLLGVVQAAIGLTALVTVPILGMLSPSVFFLMIKFHDMWWVLQVILFLIVLALLIFPTMLMGATFPLVTRILSQGRGEVGPIAGRAYGINALGTITGAFLAGFIMVPHPALGMQKTLIFATMLNLGLGVLAALIAPQARPLRRALTIGVTVGLWLVVLMICVPKRPDGSRGWNIDIVTSSPFFYYEQFFEGSSRADLTFEQFLSNQGERVDYREGPFTTVVVRRGAPNSNRSYMLYSGGRPEASDADTQQNLLAHLGLFLHPNPENVCVVGLGSGTSARTATYHPVVRRLDVVEISPAIRALSAKYFPDIHADLEAAGANVIVADGRNHLTLTDQTYDVIVSQPSHPHLTGVASLFTRDFFQIIRDRLSEDGVCVIWNFSWRIETEDFRSFLASFQNVFPTSYVVLASGSYVFVIGFKSENPEIDWQAMAERLAQCEDPRVLSDTSVGDALNTLVWDSPADILELITIGPRTVAEYTGDVGLNTDDNARLEFRLPRSFDIDRTDAIRRAIRLRQDRVEAAPGEIHDPQRHESIWEHVINAPPEVLPDPIRRWRESADGP